MNQPSHRAAWRTLPQLRLPLVFLFPLALLFLCQLITLQDWGAAAAWVDSHVQAAFFSYLLLLLIQLLVQALTGEPANALAWPVLIGWTVVFAALAVWAYRRDEGRRFR